MKPILFVFIILSLYFLPVNAQDISSPDSKGEIPKESAFQRQQEVEAILVSLREVLRDSKEIDDIRQRADVVAQGTVTLWDHDREFAKDAFAVFIENVLSEYLTLLKKASPTKEDEARIRELDFAVKKAIRILARKDVESASAYQERYFELRQAAYDRADLSDKMDLAAEGLDLDEQRAVAMLYAILQTGVPGQFPKLILDLKQKNPMVAENLVQMAIQQLAVNRNYGATDAVNLSVVVFNEAGIVIPYVPPDEDPNRYGLMTSFIGVTESPTGSAQIQSFYSASQSFFNLRLNDQQAGYFNSPRNVIGAYFFNEKLRAYAQVYGLAEITPFNYILGQMIPIADTAGITVQTMSNLSSLAHNIVTNNNPLGVDDGTSLLDKAEKAKTPEEKLEYLIRAIIQLTEFKEFAKAESHIFDIRISEIRDALYLLVHQRASFDAIENRNWAELEKRTARISDKKIRAFLYLKALSSLKPDEEQGSEPIEFAVKAEKNIMEVTDKVWRGSALLYLARALSGFSEMEVLRLMPITLKTINESPEYNENKLSVSIKIPERPVEFVEFLGSDTFREVFLYFGRKDWVESRIQAAGLKQKGLRALAGIYSAKGALSELSREDEENT